MPRTRSPSIAQSIRNATIDDEKPPVLKSRIEGIHRLSNSHSVAIHRNVFARQRARSLAWRCEKSELICNQPNLREISKFCVTEKKD